MAGSVCHCPQNFELSLRHCTGVDAVDELLWNADFNLITQLAHSYQYRLIGFCRVQRLLRGIGRGLFIGNNTHPHSGLINLAAFFAYAMWDTSAEANRPWTQCDDNNWLDNTICNDDLQDLYSKGINSSLLSGIACAFDTNMAVKATSEPLFGHKRRSCEPGTSTAGCCWWGRGAIKIAGRYRYGRLQRHVLSKIEAFTSVNICQHPGAVCELDEVMWAGAIYEWASQVQTNRHFGTSLRLYVENGFSLQHSAVGATKWEPPANFISGASNAIQENTWGPYPVGKHNIEKTFRFIVEAFMSAGLKRLDKRAEVTPSEQITSEGRHSSIRCGKTWSDANLNCGTLCVNDKDCSDGQQCFKDLVKCSDKKQKSETNKIVTIRCGKNWLEANKKCGSSCLEDEDCPGEQRCFRDLDNNCLRLLKNNFDGSYAPANVPNSNDLDILTKLNQRCGKTWPDANSKCGTSCSSNADCKIKDEECYKDIDTDVCGKASAPIPKALSPSNESKSCTGNAAVDTLLYQARIKDIAQISSSNVYDWDGFCKATRLIKQAGLPLLLGGVGQEAVGAVNIASLLAQCMWESGGDAPFTACDENNYKRTATAACTQRDDGQLYHSLVSATSCKVDAQMRMKAETFASWTPGPLECVPGTVTEKCCWWGRGAIQTTGPHNYGELQRNIIAKIPELKGVDVCVNPEAICQRKELKWIGALYYWTSVVQKDPNFGCSLNKFVSSGFNLVASKVGGADFASGCGGSVNNGRWAVKAHGDGNRLANFKRIIDALKSVGMSIPKLIKDGCKELLPRDKADRSIRCGPTWIDASKSCGSTCNNDEDCKSGQRCYKDLGVDACVTKTNSSPKISDSPSAESTVNTIRRYKNKFTTFGVPPAGYGDFRFGLMNADHKCQNNRLKSATNNGIQIRHRYQYVNAGVDPKKNALTWLFADWTHYCEDSMEKTGTSCSFVIYMLQEEGGIPKLKEHIDSRIHMQNFLKTIKIVAQQCKGHSCQFVVEPDTWCVRTQHKL